MEQAARARDARPPPVIFPPLPRWSLNDPVAGRADPRAHINCVQCHRFRFQEYYSKTCIWGMGLLQNSYIALSSRSSVVAVRTWNSKGSETEMSRRKSLRNAKTATQPLRHRVSHRRAIIDIQPISRLGPGRTIQGSSKSTRAKNGRRLCLIKAGMS